MEIANKSRPATISGQSGYIALLAVVAIGAASLIIAKNITFLGLSFVEIGMNKSYGYRAELAAESCVEEALGRIRAGRGIDGGIQLEFAASNCSVSAVKNGENWDIAVRGIASEYSKSITLTVELNNKLTIKRWEE